MSHRGKLQGRVAGGYTANSWQSRDVGAGLQPEPMSMRFLVNTAAKHQQSSLVMDDFLF